MRSLLVCKLKKHTDKTEGGTAAVMDMIIIIIAIVVAVILTNLFINSNIRTNFKNDVDIIMRRYLLVMESEGYLSDEKQKELVNQLEALGIYNIDLTGTTVTQVEYGNYVTLSFTGNVDMQSYNLISLFSMEKEIEVCPVNRYLISTSQY